MAEQDTAGRRSPFFEVYKRGQGYYTRVCTGIAAGILIVEGARYLAEQLSVIGKADDTWAQVLRIGLPAVFFVVFGLIIWWLVGVNRKICDFMIATESEMKKVSWSSRKEIIGSTKVVIFFTLMLALTLFIVDILFQTVFSSIGILRSAKMMDAFKAMLGFD